MTHTLKKTVYLHIPKTGGKTIQTYFFGGTVGDPHRKSLRVLENAHHYKDHLVFTFVRNPWDRLVSLYHCLHDHPGNQPQDRKLEEIIRKYTFEEFARLLPNMLEAIGIRQNEMWQLTTPQMTYILSAKGVLGPSFIGRFEKLAEDLQALDRLLDRESKPIPHKNKSKHKPYQEYYSPELAEFVGNFYSEDIEFLNYTFEGG